MCKQNGQHFTERGALSLAWWHRLVISATQEAKQGGSQVQGLPGQLSKAMSQNKVKWTIKMTYHVKACYQA